MSETALYILYAILAVGAAGLYLALPSARKDARHLRRVGAILGAAALAGVAVYLTRWIDPAFQGRVFFIIFAILAVLAAVRVITHERPVYSAMYFVLVVLASTGLCIFAAAEFLAAALVIIYGGAILVTYVFVIMLAQQAGGAPYDRASNEPIAAIVLGLLLAAAAAQAMVMHDPIAAHAARSRSHYRYAVMTRTEPVVRTVADEQTPSRALAPPAPGNTRAVGTELLTTYVIALEVAGVLLLVAVVGAIAVARKRIEPEALTPEERRRLEEVEGEDLRRRGRQVVPF